MAEERVWESFLSERDRALVAAMRRPEPVEVTRGPVALLVVDVVIAFTGSRPWAVRRAIEEYGTSCGENAWAALPYVIELIERFRTARSSIFWTRCDPMVASVVGSVTNLTSGRAKDVCATESGNHFPDGAGPREGEVLIEKGRASAFFGTPLALMLHSNHVQSVVVVGGSTSGCVRATAVDAHSWGFDTYVVAEACFDRFDASHAMSLFDIHTKYGTVLSPSQVNLRKNPIPSTHAEKNGTPSV